MDYSLSMVWGFIKSIRTVRREVVGFALVGTIIGSICVDSYIQHHQPIEVINHAEAQVVATSTPEIVLIEPLIVWDRKRILTEIDTVARKYNVSSSTMRAVVNCESQYNKEARGDGGKSRGLVQIHKGYHPGVTDDMADNPTFALDFLGKALANHQGNLWSCFRMMK